MKAELVNLPEESVMKIVRKVKELLHTIVDIAEEESDKYDLIIPVYLGVGDQILMRTIKLMIDFWIKSRNKVLKEFAERVNKLEKERIK